MPTTDSHRHAETPLQIPTASQALRAVGRLVRLRCPACGDARVLTSRGTVHKRCAACNFRFERTDDRYFAGAMFFGLLLGEALFAVTLLIVMIATWPNPPWNVMSYAPVGMLLVMLVMIPVSRVVWVSVDVLVRPVVAAERI
jgi:uncharacterized protein (DUF983 family)